MVPHPSKKQSHLLSHYYLFIIIIIISQAHSAGLLSCRDTTLANSRHRNKMLQSLSLPLPPLQEIEQTMVAGVQRRAERVLGARMRRQGEHLLHSVAARLPHDRAQVWRMKRVKPSTGRLTHSTYIEEGRDREIKNSLFTMGIKSCKRIV